MADGSTPGAANARRGFVRAICGSLAAVASGTSAAPKRFGEPIRLAVIEGLSGPFANAGESVMRNLQFAVDRINQRGGVAVGSILRPFELVPLDSKGQVDEALAMLRLAGDRSIRFVLQGNSSAVAGALSEAVSRHNERTPDGQMLFLNYSAVDPTLTNERCSFWHFRFDAHADMRAAALAEAIAQNRSVRSVYLINQDYAFGRQVAARARESIARLRPDIVIAGDELHPLGRVRDFAPYANKIAASGADTVVTGNWGNDLSLLVRAGRDAGLVLDWYTFYGNSLGAPAAIGEAGIGRVRAVSEWHPDAGILAGEAIHAEFRKRLRDPRDDYFNMRHVLMIEMLTASIQASSGSASSGSAGSVPVAGAFHAAAVARALEGRVYRGQPYEVTMRREDHQLLTPLYVTVMDRVGARGVQFDVEGSGYGFRTERFVALEQLAQPSSCRMVRPKA